VNLAVINEYTDCTLLVENETANERTPLSSYAEAKKMKLLPMVARVSALFLLCLDVVIQYHTIKLW